MNPQEPRYNALASLVTMSFGLILINFLAGYFLSDFWLSYFGSIQKLSMYSAEFLTVLAAFLTLSAVALVIAKVCRLKLVTAVYLFAFLPTLLFTVLSWSFYILFERFAGSYGLQMLIYDGSRIFGIGSGMGGVYSNSVPLIAGAFAAAVSIAYISLAKNPLAVWARYACAGLLTIPAVLSIALTVNGSVEPEIPEEYGNDPGIRRITQTTAMELRSKSGPFSAMAREVSGLVFSDSSQYRAVLDKIKLVPIVSRTDKPTAVPEPRQNIIFVLVESMSPAALAINGGPETIMPTVNSLANRGLVFSNVWAQSSHSNYADIAALSGQYPLRSESIHFYPKNPSYPRSLPWDHLSQYGYLSAGFSSGDDNWGRMTNYLNTKNLEIFDHAGNEAEEVKGSLRGPSTVSEEDDGRLYVNVSEFMMGGARTYGTSRLDEITTNKAMSWVDSKPVDEPVFVYLNYQASHYPYNLLPENFERRHLTEESAAADKVRSGDAYGQPLALVRDGYYDSLSYVDENIAAVVEHMEKRDPGNNVYVIAADTATVMGEQLIGNGGTLLAEVLKIPLIVAMPSKASTTLVNLPMAQIDILPTVYGLVGVTPDPASQGEDVIGKQDSDRFIFSLAQSPAAHQYSVIYQDWQLVVDYDLQKMLSQYVGYHDQTEPPEISLQIKQQMASALDTWVDIQLGYYKSPGIHGKYYPPAYAEIAGLVSAPLTDTATATLTDN